MNTEAILPISWEGWDPGDQTEIFLGNATFLEDFGIFKKGEKYEGLFISYGEGFIEAYDEEGQINKKQNFKAIPC